MTGLDLFIQRLRIAAALEHLPANGHVLDVGCGDGAFFRQGSSKVASGVGIDVLAPQEEWVFGPFERRTGSFPEKVGDGERFDAVVMLAVVEHLRDHELARWASAVPEVVEPGGKLIITTPSPVVDRILDAGIKLRLLDGMEAHQHHGFDPRQVPDLFTGPTLHLEHRRRFELGLNHLFVFRVLHR
ncbi:MAG: class I SAM-dependent methyltransferase [Iamia sp.]